MTSQVNPNNIDGSYPVAGQDNDSQGFRDNFTNIRNNFTFIKSEVEDLQNKAVLKSSLTNSTLNNDFAGNAISNATLTSWRETYNNVSNTANGAITIDFANGNFQKIGITGAVSPLTFFWPDNTSGYYASIKLWINVANSAHTVTFATAPTLGDPDTIAGYSAGVLSFNAAELANNNDYLFEIFTLDGGSTLGIKDLIRNRDVDLSGMSITGNLALDNISVSGNVTSGNVTSGNVYTTTGIFWAGNGTPFSIGGGSGSFSTVTASSTIIGSGNIVAAATANNTTGGDTTVGALIVKGSTGVAGNVNVGGNLWVNSGNIRTTGTVANIFNLTATTISIGNAASFVSVGNIGSNIFVGGRLTVVGNITTSSNLNLAPGTTTVAPLSFNPTSSALLTVPLQGAVEYDSTANVFYATPTSSTTSGRAIIPTQHTFVLQNTGNIDLNGGGTIATVNTAYGAFGNLNVTVAASTTYEVDARIHIGFAAAPTSSTLQFTFGGTATATGYNYDVTVINGSFGGVSTSNSMSNWYGSASGGTISFPSATLALVSGAQTFINVLVRVKGIIRTSAQGTLIPQLAWGTLPAQTARVVRGSYIALTPLGNITGNVSVGNFTLV